MLWRYSQAEHLLTRTECYYEGHSYSHGSVLSTPAGQQICVMQSAYPSWIPTQHFLPSSPDQVGTIKNYTIFSEISCDDERLQDLLARLDPGSS